MALNSGDQQTLTEQNKSGYSSLHLAVLDKNETLVNQLLEDGCQINVRDSRGQTALHLAVSNEFQKGIDLLLDNHCDVNLQDEDGNTPVHLVFKSKYWETNGGEDLEQTEDMHIVTGRRHCNVLCKKMINNGVNLKIQNVKGQTLLHLAVFRNVISICRLILEKCNDVNVLDENHQTPLSVAAMKEYYSISKILLTMGALVNVKDVNGNYPLHYAAMAGNKKMVNLFLNNGAEIGVKDANGQTALHIAVKDPKCFKVVQLLVERRGEVNEQDINGDTPLHLAVEYLRPNDNYTRHDDSLLLKLLLDWGADMEIRNLSGVTPLDNVQWRNILTDHIVKLRAAKLSDNIQYQFDGNLPEAYEKSCLEELDRMKILRFFNCSIYDFLCNSNDLLYFSSSELDDIIPCFESTFPTYYTLLTAKVIKIKQRKVLLCGARKCFNIPLPTTILEKILRFVSNKDLENIISTNVQYASYYLKLTMDIKHNWYQFSDHFSQENLPFFRAIKKRSIDDLKVCVKDKSLPSGKPTHILNYAVKKDFDEGVRFLLESGLDINIKGVKGESALHCAAWKHKETIADLLINSGADIDSEDDYGHTPLHMAMSAQNIYITELLLEKGCNVNAKNKYDSSILNHLFKRRGYDFDKTTAEICYLLIKHGADANSKDSKGITSFMRSIASNCNPTICQFLLDSGADVNSMDNKKKTPLHIACNYRGKHSEEVCQMLLSRGADVGAQDIQGRSPLHLAALHTKIEILKQLVAVGGDLGARDLEGQTVLHYAVKNNKEANCVRFLLENGVDVNPSDSSGKTPLHICLSAWCDSNSIVTELMGWGGSHILKSYQNMAPLLKNAKPAKLRYFVKCIVGLHCAKIIEASPYVLMTNELNLFQQSCFLELKTMKNTKFGQNTCYEVISNYSDPRYVLNKELEEVLSSDDFKSHFPIYSSLLYITFLKAKKRFAMMNSGQEHLKLDLPNETIVHILTFLDDDELKSLLNTLICTHV